MFGVTPAKVIWILWYYYKRKSSELYVGWNPKSILTHYSKNWSSWNVKILTNTWSAALCLEYTIGILPCLMDSSSRIAISIIITQGKQIIIIFPHSKQTWGKPVLDIKALLFGMISWNTKLTSVQVITCLLRTLKASYCKNVYDQILQFPTLNCYYCITKHTVHVIISYVLNPLMKHTQCINHYFTVINMNLSNLCCNLCTELI